MNAGAQMLKWMNSDSKCELCKHKIENDGKINDIGCVLKILIKKVIWRKEKY